MKQSKHKLEEGTVICPKCNMKVPDSKCCVFCGEPLDERLKELTKNV